MNLNRPLRTFSLLKFSVRVKRMPKKTSMNLSFNHFYLLAYKLKTSGAKVGYECRWIREANATLKTKRELQTFADFHCLSPHKTEVFTCRNTHIHSFHLQLYSLNFYVLINQSRKISTSKPSVYIKSLTQIIYCFITLAVLLQTFHLKDSESCPTFKFWGDGGGALCF